MKAPSWEEPVKVHSELLFSQKCPRLKPGPIRGCHVQQRVRAGPALPLGTRAAPVPSEHLPVKGCVTCTWREPHPWEASQVKGKGQSWGQSEGGRGLPSGTLRRVGGDCRSSSGWGAGQPQLPASPRPACILSGQKEPLNPSPPPTIPSPLGSLLTGQSSFQNQHRTSGVSSGF